MEQAPPPNQIPASARLADDADWIAQPVDIGSVGEPMRKFSWLSPRTLWHSRNNVLASLSGDPTEHARAAWVAQQRKSTADFSIARPELGEFSFMVLGDTGEGDRSQYSVVPAFLKASEGSEFAVIASDVVYPAGDVNDYVEKFFVPYPSYPRPIYAIPGNHDWLDGLAGFMRHFCAADPPAAKFKPPPRASWSKSATLIHNVLWRRPRALSRATTTAAQRLRGSVSPPGPVQPNMYFCIETPNLRIVLIDTGILGRIDHEQGAWLAEVSAGPKPKLLISGKPIYSGASVSPRRILDPTGAGSSGTLWSIVKDPANNYLAMISGDIHHYERHSVRLDDGRTMQCLIAGGGGAFMSSTHQIPRVDRPDVSEREWVVFPTRGDSLRAYSIALERRLARRLPWRRRRPVGGIPADEAAAIVAERHGLELAAELARGEGAGLPPVKVSARSRRLASFIFPRRRWFNPEKVSEALDWDDPPFFKNFVRVNVDSGGVELVVHGVTGLARDADQPAVIDRVRIPIAVGGCSGGRP